MEIPRQYQTELFEQAKNGNIIAVLDTGSGKTLIALMVLQYIKSQSAKVSFFLVPTIPLVSQQKQYLTANSSLEVYGFSGESRGFTWDSLPDVVVLTPQILLSAFDHGFIQMKDISLLVFDECHHTTGDHPFNLIMKQHYIPTSSEHRPKIFGMTASPMASKTTQNPIRELEQNLCSKAITSNHLQVQFKPVERIEYYDMNEFFEPPKVYTKIMQEVPEFLKIAQQEIGDCLAFSDLLGPWCADRALEIQIKEVKKRCRSIIKRKQATQNQYDIEEENYSLDMFANIYADSSQSDDSLCLIPISDSDDSEDELIGLYEALEGDSATQFNTLDNLTSEEEAPQSSYFQNHHIRFESKVDITTTSNINEVKKVQPALQHFVCDDRIKKPKKQKNKREVRNYSAAFSKFASELGKNSMLDSAEEGEIIVDEPIKNTENAEMTVDSNYNNLNGIGKRTHSSPQNSNKRQKVNIRSDNLMKSPIKQKETQKPDLDTLKSEIESSAAADGLNYKRSKKSRNVLESCSTDELEAYQYYCQQLEKSPDWDDNASPPSEHELGAKVKKLVNILLEFKDDSNFCGIVFCQHRIVAKVLQKMAEKHRQLGFIRSAFLIGHANQKLSGMKTSNQTEIVNKFKNGQVNLIFATNVAEEGLDIKPCNCVIRFDSMDTSLISYIQSRGRARHMESQFIILAERGVKNMTDILEKLRSSEIDMKQSVSTYIEVNDEIELEKFEPKDFYLVERTGAKATVYNAINILSNYCSCLPRDGYFTPEPEYFIAKDGNQFAAEVFLPKGAHSACTKLRGSLKKSELAANRDVALKMVKLLHSAGELDDNLKPRRYLSGTNRRNSTKNQTKKRKKILESHGVFIPSSFNGNFVANPTISVYVNFVRFRNVESVRIGTIGFTTFRPLPVIFEEEFPFMLSAKNIAIKVKCIQKPLRLTQDQLKQFKKFHYEFSKVTLKSKFEEDFEWVMYYIPLIENINANNVDDPKNIVDWSALDYCYNHNPELSTKFDIGAATLAQIQEYAYQDPHRYNRYFVIERIEDNTPEAPLNLEKYHTVLSLYKNRFKCKEEIKLQQKMWHAEPIGHPQMSIQMHTKISKVSLIPQLLKFAPIKRRHILESRSMPLLTQIFNHRLLMLDLIEGTPFTDRVGSIRTSINLLQQAFTTSVCSLPFNYERLETLGDAFLKLYLGVHLFVKFPNKPEGFLAKSRTEFESNKNLRRIAGELELEGFILSSSFSRRKFIPPALLSEKSKLQTLCDKTIADVIEATIGACFAHGGELNASNCVRFFLGEDFESNFAIYSLLWKKSPTKHRTVDNYMQQACKTVQARIGYEFRDINYLYEALTHATACIGENNSYERLEFIGDSILGFVVTKFVYLYDQSLTPGLMSELRSELVNNQFLSAVSVNLDLIGQLDHQSPRLGVKLKDWSLKFLAAQKESEYTLHEKPQNIDDFVLIFWNHMEVAPKTIGDIYESVLGAVFIDSGFKINIVEKVIKKTLFDPFWPRFELLMKESHGLQTKHPIRNLLEFLDQFQCKGLDTMYVMFNNSYEDLPNGDSVCALYLHGITLAKVTSSNQRDARKNASSLALKYINDSWNTINAKCDCRYKELDDF